MLRTLYFFLALVAAACFTFGGFGGVIYEAYNTLNNIEGGSLSGILGWSITGGGLIGYILFSYLFVHEDDREDTDEDD